ncbi:hypothetical protein GH5_05609 [Leishmania sp. Ghana 2012 LV757]|uniref:Uncharacterized protein n=1 Tax=Leishmania orientalis TaxID=2249476 RepID=A0A836HWC7_9TRYP|nr:hypothetical protein LSCM4_04916 [Leishmania orientalis]KAG5505141.1 hypothetical protein JIQ42_04328 [Leishmania sp. Namibia]KAG5509745.1 hypothetical protein GH5_05609 [Leishmania sp. Ghana 2012 LV757]
MPAVPPSRSWSGRLYNLYTANKREAFFGLVALFALATVARAEMMRKGVLQPPSPQDVHPKVTREFGKSKGKFE